MKKKIFSALGIMTGTSIDGVDLSLIKSDGINEFEPILDDYFEFNKNIQKKTEKLRDELSNIDDLDRYSKDLNELEREITIFIGECINRFVEKNDQEIDLIGFHGQTVFHDSNIKTSLQLGNGSLLSSLTKKTVINNFRQKDLLNGGQGAPLTPIYHKLISTIINKRYEVEFPINIINIGGITNVTKIIDNNQDPSKNIFAFDIGPGNCLIDGWIKKNSVKRFDHNGELAKFGNVDQLILNQAIDNFSGSKFDRSLDVKNFDFSFVKGLSIEDGCATITNFTAYLIAEGINFVNRINNKDSQYNLICGGGRKNDYLVDCIKENLSKDLVLKKIDAYGFNGDYIESQAFAYLAVRSYLNLPISFPNTTKCNEPTVGGEINENF